MKLILLSMGLLSISSMMAKEVFEKKDIAQYLTLKNPFYYSAVGEKFIYEEKKKYHLGAFDTKLKAKYDNKDYKVSEGEFLNLGVEKPLDHGIDLSLDYRKATGVQEYNNIKTGKEGELLLGVKVPVFSVIEKINKRDYNLNAASIESKKVTSLSKNNLRLLHYEILYSYYTLLYYKGVHLLVEDLLSNAKKRKKFIHSSVLSGTMAEIELLEIEQQIINREQNLISVKNIYQSALLDFLKYLNMDKKTFFKLYSLSSLENSSHTHKSIKEAIQFALEHRPDLKVFDFDREKLMLEGQYSNLLKYPDLKLGLYGSHDIQYGNGFKFSLEMDFPVEQRKYRAKNLEIKSSLLNLEKKMEMKIINIKISVRNIVNSLNTLLDNIKKSKSETRLVEKLENAENKKYKLGLSNIFMVNQREMQTLKVKQKLLKYHLDYLLLKEELNKEINAPI
ncbi:MAG: TolC family protein [Campylobacterota bacterium]|nr:TolC family protein [Campylobacterota bacterium]